MEEQLIKRTNERLLKQNFTVARIASGALYLTTLCLLITILKVRQIPTGLNISFENKPLVIAIATGIPFLLNMAIIIYHIKKLLSNFTENSKYKIFFNLSWISMLVCFWTAILYAMLPSKEVMTTFSITPILALAFWMYALYVFSNNQTYEDFIGKIYILTDGYDYYSGDRLTGSARRMRDMYNFFAKPLMFIEVFKDAQSYSYRNGYRQE